MAACCRSRASMRDSGVESAWMVELELAVAFVCRGRRVSVLVGLDTVSRRAAGGMEVLLAAGELRRVALSRQFIT